MLAGGQAQRLGGVNKMLLPLHGATIVDLVLQELRPRTCQVWLSTHRESEFSGRGCRFVRDLDGLSGPLAGIASALRVIETPFALVVAGDMPFVSSEVLDQLLGADATWSAVAVRVGNRYEPLLARYHRDLAEHAIALARAGRGPKDLLAQGLVGAIEVADGADCLTNVNTPSDLQRAEQK